MGARRRRGRSGPREQPGSPGDDRGEPGGFEFLHWIRGTVLGIAETQLIVT